MYLPDLSEYLFLPDQPLPGVRAVGWLEKGHDFTTGDVPARLVTKLEDLIARRPVNLARGWHACSFCYAGLAPDARAGDWRAMVAAAERARATISTPQGQLFLGAAEVWLRDRSGVVYAAPNLIHHYITQHHYQPPAAFLTALDELDPQDDWDPAQDRARRIAALSA